ncbi:hypothetical protein [Flavobacterium humi]|uniref:Cell wall anchor protein n=1 Tax=Flavobacterium humi TaxID=2562683 RepID=A0A4Z0LCQ9_9FLAO|nr:hypothetical protein [Flavobacterium humi]TGD59661.1 hypothetical protein E4635_01640 [Flavobacterium humi]
MKKNLFIQILTYSLLLFSAMQLSAQVGIGTSTPAASSVLDITSTTKGLLAPRMTTAQRIAIASPANGLMVYDTDIKSFHYYDTSTSAWIKVFGDKEGRLKYKLIKSTDVLATVLATELAAGGGTKYVLDTSTLYEVNGTIVVNFPIDLNNAYIVGQDAGEDKLVRTTGNLFEGDKGGSVKILTLVASSGQVFNLLGTGGQTQNLILRDCIIASSASIGKIENFALAFMSIVQFAGNTTGIIYKDITKLLISNAAWFGTNTGTYETYQGTFGLIEKEGGFTEVIGTAVGFDVSANPTITGDAVMDAVVFTGTVTTGKYINPYTVGTYSGYNFNDSWGVRCAGIPNEGDTYATGAFYFDRSGAPANTIATTINTAYKLTGTTVSSNLYRFTAPTNNRLTYMGKKTRSFQVIANVAYLEVSGGSNAQYVYYLAKVSTPATGSVVTPITATEAFTDTNSGFVQGFSIAGTVSLSTGESVEVYLKRINSGTKITMGTYSLNLSMK